MTKTLATLLLACFGLPALCAAQGPGGTVPEAPQASEETTTVFHHSDKTWWWISGQINVIYQAHPDFRALYSGPNSLPSQGEGKMSRVMTLYTGARLGHTTEVIFDVESAGGRGIGDALGLAGFTNLDVVRSPDLGSKPYLARLMLRQVIPLTKRTQKVERGPLSILTELPERRLEFRLGKFGMADFFDLNSVGSDSHLQFMNWTVDNNGAYDYAADTRGYTWGAILEYHDRIWSVRFAEALMPKVANGIRLDWDLRRARAENVELEIRKGFLPGHAGAVRLLSYVNHADMGSYREAVQAFLSGSDPVPDITAHRLQGRVKYGFGLNFEQELGHGLRVFGRGGWNEGKNESFAYTEVNQTFAGGADLSGEHWKRKLDKIGLAFATNAISSDHQRYLALGGQGFLLGDGKLNYGREDILEGYYTAHFWRGVFGSFDLQYIDHPGYNRDRGPVVVPGIRLHLEL